MKKSSWGLCIDIEGFSSRYEHSEEMKNNAIIALHNLMRAIINIGTLVYPGQPDNNFSERLFAHQFGDGFIITSDFYEKSPERCVSIAISLMRHMMINGVSTKVAISTGDMSDINGCYPREVRDSQSNSVHLGMGLLTTISVMGTALTKSHSLSGRSSGSVLILDCNGFETVPTNLVTPQKSGISLIDWVSLELPLAKHISEVAGLDYGNKEILLKKFNTYIAQVPVPPKKWIASTRDSWVGSKHV